MRWPPQPENWPPDTVEECSDYYESAYKMGNKDALILLIGMCGIAGWPIPKWAASIIVEAPSHAIFGRIRSWDEVFGKPHTPKKGTRLLEWQRRWHVFAEVQTAHSKGEAIDDLLFERIGKKLGIGGRTKAKDLYAAARDEFELNKRRNALRRSNAKK
jgi:hypothetical protein